MAGQYGRYPAKTDMRGARFGMFTFDTDGATDPSVWDDGGAGIVSSIAEAASGTFTVTLTQTFANVMAVAQIDTPDDHICNVTSTTATTIVIQVTDRADPGANEESTGDTITVMYVVSDA